MAATHCSASSMQHGAPSSLKPCWECKIRAQLGLDWDTLWKKRRRYPVRRRRLHRVASADLRGSRRHGLQLRPENVRSTLTDPVWHINMGNKWFLGPGTLFLTLFI